MNNIKKIKLEDIDSFKNHPFKVENDESLKELSNSIKENGLLNPLTVRLKSNGRYELISGHRRKFAMELIGIKEADAYVKDLTDNQAIIEMVDSNMYRDKILPSEKAFAYKMKLDAIKDQRKTMCPRGTKIRSDQILGEEVGESARQLQRYIRLTYLIPELLQLVDDTVLKDKRAILTMGIKPAVELSYLSITEQKLVYNGILYEDLTPSHGQARIIRQLAKDKILDFDSLEEVLCEQKGNQKEQISFNRSRIDSSNYELIFTDKKIEIHNKGILEIDK